MDLIWFISGIIIWLKKAVPPNLLGGSVRHTVDQDVAQSIGFMLMLPFVFTVGGVICRLMYFPSDLVSVIRVGSYICAIIAIGMYYKYRRPIPVDDQGMLAGTDIPADKADIAQKIANRAYSPILMVILMVITGPLELIFAAWGLILANQAIRMSTEHQIAAAQRKWAQGMRIVIIVGMLLLLVCNLSVVALIMSPDILGTSLDGDNPLGAIFATPTPTALPTYGPSVRYQSIHEPTPDDLYFGDRLQLIDDLLIVSAPGAFIGEYRQVGCVYVYRSTDWDSDSGVWQEAARLQVSGDPQNLEMAEFGRSFAYSDGVLAIAAPGYHQEGRGPGAVFIYRRGGEDATEWIGPKILSPLQVDPEIRFGTSVALSGSHLAVDAENLSTKPISSIYMFEKDDSSFKQKAIILPPKSLEFETDMAFAEEAFVVRTYNDDQVRERTEVYYLEGDQWILSDEALSDFGGPFAVGDRFIGMLRYDQRDNMNANQRINYFRYDGSWTNPVQARTFPLPRGIADPDKLQSIAADNKHVAISVPVAYPPGPGVSTVFIYGENGLVTTVRLGPNDPLAMWNLGNAVAINGPHVAVNSSVDARVVVFYVREIAGSQ